MRHVIGIGLAVGLAAAVFFAASWGYLRLLGIPVANGGASTLPATLSTTSDYFTINGLGSFAGTRTFVYAVIRRTGPGPQLLLSWHED